jgi:hypothetical protein
MLSARAFAPSAQNCIKETQPVSETYELMHHALKLAETAKDMMRSDKAEAPDDSTLSHAETILSQTKKMLPDNAVVQGLKLSAKTWPNLRIVMDAAANALSSASTRETIEAVANRNRRYQAGPWS